MTAQDISTPSAAPARASRQVFLRDLGVARENLRFDEAPDGDIPNLAATLKAAGQLQPLTVRPGRGKKEKAWMALDGRRRLYAFGMLCEAGDIADDQLIDVFVETDPARQAAATLLTNTAVPVHVADVIAATGRMLKSKLTVEVIARALGYAEIEVRRLAALSALPAVALEALKAGRITLKQARLLARLSDRRAQTELAHAALAGHGFQDWRIIERLDGDRVTARDRRCALISPEAYASAGGRIEADLFGERPPVLLDPGILTEAWEARVNAALAPLAAGGVDIRISAVDEPEPDEALDALGWGYGQGLPPAELDRYRAARDDWHAARDAIRSLLDDDDAPAAAVDGALVALARTRLGMDAVEAAGRPVVLCVWPDGSDGFNLRCYAPEREADPQVDETEGETEDEGEAAAPPPYAPAPGFPAPAMEIEGGGHRLHALRTEVATRALIRALADDPSVALTVTIARLFAAVALPPRPTSESALTIRAEVFAPRNGRVIESLDGPVRESLADRRAAFAASGQTVIAWVHGLPHGEKMALLAELTALSLDVMEPQTFLVRRSARSEAAEIAALCDCDVTQHWTPDAPFLEAHSKGLLIGMLESMQIEPDAAGSLKKAEWVDLVAEFAAERRWAPAALSWRADPVDAAEIVPAEGDPDPADAPDLEGADGAGAFEVTPAGEAALEQVAA